jgi:hypothetical protein
MNCIKEIGLALTIVAAYTVYIGRELQFLKFYISKIRYYYFFKYRHKVQV